ncbi:MAG: hypothetical protein F6K26_47115 [Moorea sp. SIO2I5]|nr:hypothetical protein [Moorena sp. SIO2I5]
MANLITGQTHHYGLGEAARSWGVPPTRALPWFPQLALCRGLRHSRFALVSPTRALHQDLKG